MRKNSMQLELPLPVPDGIKLIFRPWRTTRTGKVLWAKHYGIRAWPMYVKA